MEERISDKENLLDEYDRYQKKRGNLDKRYLFMALALLFFTLSVITPKIYLRNNIYFISKDIALLKNQEELLVEENRAIKRELEDIKFRLLVTDIEF